jgi:hypothetical protein
MHKMRHEDLYESDFVRWAEEQAAALREGRFLDLDLPNLSEEIEALSRSDRRELGSRLTILLMHLIKLAIQPDKATRSWLSTIIEQTARVHDLLSDSPSLSHGNFFESAVTAAYGTALSRAAAETGVSIDTSSEFQEQTIRRLRLVLTEGDSITWLEELVQAAEGKKRRSLRRLPWVRPEVSETQ